MDNQMTKEPIMIDGVNVKDCKRRIGKDNFCRYYKRPCAENNYNCIWKKYLRKEQECEELKKSVRSNKDKRKSAIERYLKLKEFTNKEFNKLKAENEKMLKGYEELTEIVSPYIDDFTGYNEELKGFDIVLCVKELMQQLDRFKVENEHLSEKEEEARHYLEESYNYKQALQEIKDYCNKYPQNSIGFKQQILQKCEVIKE